MTVMGSYPYYPIGLNGTGSSTAYFGYAQNFKLLGSMLEANMGVWIDLNRFAQQGITQRRAHIIFSFRL